MEDTALLDKTIETPAAVEPKVEPDLLDKQAPETKADPAKPSDQKPVGDAKPEADAKPVGAPEKYTDPKLPEGFSIPAELRSLVDVFAKEQNLPQEKYQAMIDLGAKLTEQNTKAMIDTFESTKKQWREQTVKELGADYEKELSAAAKAIDSVFTDPKENAEFRGLLKENGMSNHPLMVRLMRHFGKAISEDSLVNAKPEALDKKTKPVAEVFFDHPHSVAARNGG